MAYITKDQVTNVRKQLKEKFPNFKFSIRGGNSSKLEVSILKSPFDFMSCADEYDRSRGHKQINHYHTENYGDYKTIFDEIVEIMLGQDWYDNSDSQTDYFEVAYYISLEVGRWNKPYVKGV